MPLRRMLPSLSLILLAAAGGSGSASASENPGTLIHSARRLEAEVTGDNRKLRLRHNLERLIAAWRRVGEAAKTDAQARTALAGEVRAWRLLAHWSGRPEDRARAEELTRRLGTRTATAKAPEAQKIWLSKVSVESSEGRFRVVLPIRHEVQVRKRILSKKSTGRPSRVYFDLKPLVASRETLGPVPIDHASVTRVRIGQIDETTVRFVFDLDQKQETPEIVFESEEDRSSFVVTRADLLGATVVELDSDSDPLSALIDKLGELDKTPPDSSKEQAREVVSSEKASPKEAKVQAPPEPKPSAEAVDPAKIKLSRSTRDAIEPRQKDWLSGIKRVVIDAGHGGKDTGAIGRRGVREKDINLQIALKLGRELKKALGVEVVYTRKTDRFLTLRERAVVANKSGADLFVSVHANAHKNRKISGVETYYLNTTSSRYAARLAKRENAEAFDPDDVSSGEPVVVEDEDDASTLPGGPLGRDLRLLLADLAMKSAADESRRLAGFIQSSVVGTLRRGYSAVHDLGVKRALFYVLLGVRMPAVLVESGFLTNATEEKRLAEPKYQDELARSIANGIVRFVRERREIASRL